MVEIVTKRVYDSVCDSCGTRIVYTGKDMSHGWFRCPECQTLIDHVGFFRRALRVLLFRFF